MSKVYFKRNWCDYLTTCKVYSDIQVGSYECSQCKYFKESHEQNFPNREITDYKKYLDTTEENYVICNHKNK